MISRIRGSMMVLASFGVVAHAAVAQSELGPPPGRLVSVDGRNLHVLCDGTGSPTVVLESGASSFAVDWTLVQTEIARSNRVCSYDRAGHGWSDPPPGVLGETVVNDLNAALRSVDAEPPFVMVGASAGGLYVREYQARHPNDVVGMVLVDPASEDRLFTMLDGRPVLIASLSEEEVLRTVPQRDVIVPRRSPQTGVPFDRLPPDLYRTRVALETRLIASVPDTVPYALVAASVQADRARLSGLLRAREERSTPLFELPLVVLTRGLDSSPDLVAAHAGLAALSANSRHVVVEGSGHEIHLFQPQAVVNAVRDVIEAVVTGAPLAAR